MINQFDFLNTHPSSTASILPSTLLFTVEHANPLEIVAMTSNHIFNVTDEKTCHELAKLGNKKDDFSEETFSPIGRKNSTNSNAAEGNEYLKKSASKKTRSRCVNSWTDCPVCGRNVMQNEVAQKGMLYEYCTECWKKLNGRRTVNIRKRKESFFCSKNVNKWISKEEMLEDFLEIYGLIEGRRCFAGTNF